jgi:D-3-phosphoglycerate dehydrogenase / 2-oxoglutarate reductase
MLPRILIAEPLDFSPNAVRLLETAAEVTLRATDRAGLAAALGDFDGVWFRLGHRIDRQLLAGPLRCRILATPVTGLDHIDLAACRERGIRVVSLRGEIGFLEQVRGTAELTLALTLALLRRIPAAAADVECGGWNRDAFRGRELFGRTVGLVGVGRLGRIVASYFRAIGMDVAGYDPRPDFPHDAARRVASLVDLLAQSDVVSVHVSYDASTRHLIGRQELAAIKPGAVLINTSRGGLVDEQALLEALQLGSLAGAALDVLDGEPHITADHPLVVYARGCDRLLIVPHIGGNTLESFEKTECFLARRVIEALSSLVPGGCSTVGSVE